MVNITSQYHCHWLTKDPVNGKYSSLGEIEWDGISFWMKLNREIAKKKHSSAAVIYSNSIKLMPSKSSRATKRKRYEKKMERGNKRQHEYIYES